MSLSQNELLIVGKYFNDIYDYINLSKTCKNYEDILKLYKTNFIPIYLKIYIHIIFMIINILILIYQKIIIYQYF